MMNYYNANSKPTLSTP